MKFFILLTILSFTPFISSFCQKVDEMKSKLVDKILSLPEFKDSERKIDSLKQEGFEIDLSFEIIWNVPVELESQKGFAWVHVNQVLFGTINETLYFIKYQKKEEKIVSIEKQKDLGISN